MSAYIGKDNTNDNIIHFTADSRRAAQMKGSWDSQTIFHSKRPYLVIDQILTFSPDTSTIKNMDTYHIPMEFIEYTVDQTGSYLNTNKPFIIFCELDADDHVNPVYATGATSPFALNSGWYGEEFNYKIVWFGSTALTLAHVSGYSSLRKLTDNYNMNMVPLKITVVTFVNQLTMPTSSQLTGEVQISKTDGVKVGTSKFFDNGCLMLAPTEQTSATSADRRFHTLGATISPYGQTIDNTPIGYSHLMLPFSTGFEFDLENQTISNGVYRLIDPQFSYMQILDTMTFNSTNPESDTRFRIGGSSELECRSDAISNLHTQIDLSSLTELTEASILMVFLKIKSGGSDNPDGSDHYAYICGLYPYNGALQEYFSDSVTNDENRSVFSRGNGTGGIGTNFTFSFEYIDHMPVPDERNYVFWVSEKADGWSSQGGLSNVTGWIAHVNFGAGNMPGLVDVLSNTGSAEYTGSDTDVTALYNAADGSYRWKQITVDSWESTNQGDGNSYSLIMIRARVNLQLDLYSGGESEYDYITVWDGNNNLLNRYGDVAVTSDRSGTITMNAGDILSLAYRKDYNVNVSPDTGTFTLTKL